MVRLKSILTSPSNALIHTTQTQTQRRRRHRQQESERERERGNGNVHWIKSQVINFRNSRAFGTVRFVTKLITIEFFNISIRWWALHFTVRRLICIHNTIKLPTKWFNFYVIFSFYRSLTLPLQHTRPLRYASLSRCSPTVNSISAVECGEDARWMEKEEWCFWWWYFVAKSHLSWWMNNANWPIRKQRLWYVCLCLHTFIHILSLSLSIPKV